jgi:hypothetical protein
LNKQKKHDAAGIVFGVKEVGLVRLNYIAGSLGFGSVKVIIVKAEGRLFRHSLSI